MIAFNQKKNNKFKNSTHKKKNKLVLLKYYSRIIICNFNIVKVGKI